MKLTIRYPVLHRGWKIQVPPLQEARRRLLTRCTWCGGRSRPRDVVNVRQGSHGPRARWWQGERGLFHMDCASIERARDACLCDAPITEHDEGWGACLRCGKFRGHGRTDEQTARLRELAAIPAGQRQGAQS